MASSERFRVELGKIKHSYILLPSKHTADHPVTALCFDSKQELLWTGNGEGRVLSYCVGPHALDRYTRFRSHMEPVRQILVGEHGVYSLGGSTVRHTIRRGIVQWTWRTDPQSNLLAMSTTNSKIELMVSSQQGTLSILNIYRGTLMKEISAEPDIILIKKSRYMCCGSSSGLVTLRDPRTLRVEHSWQAHAGSLSDMDVVGNIMVTCGFSNRAGQLVMDPMIKLYDVRTMKSLPPLAFPAGPSFLKLHPNLSSTIFAGSQGGQFQICDITNPDSNIQFYQADISGYLTAVDFSSSGDILALAGSSGTVSFWSMPYYMSSLLSSWPSSMTFDVGRPIPTVPPEVLADVKMIDFVGYARNPGTFHRNQVTVKKKQERDHFEPKFRSEQERESLSLAQSLKHQLALDDVSTSDSEGPNPPFSSSTVPKYYRKVEIKYSKFGVEDFDFGFYNRTQSGGLETHIENSYCNSMLHVLYFTPHLRALAKWHSTLPCVRENCLTCELGFLFKMLEQSEGANCQATNFLKVLSKIPQVTALGLVEPESPEQSFSYMSLIQNFHRFILEQINQETTSINSSPNTGKAGASGSGTHPPSVVQAVASSKKKGSSTPPPPQPPPAPTVPEQKTLLQQIVGVRFQNSTKCQCQSDDVRETAPFVVDLQHKTKAAKAAATKADLAFVSVLKNTMNKETQSKAWCSSCSKYQPMVHKKTLLGPPNLIEINVNAKLEEEIESLIEYLSINGPPTPGEEDGGEEDKSAVWYELTALVAEIRSGKEAFHLVAHIKREQQDWLLFNDFLVQPVSAPEVTFIRKWKIPVILQYSRVDWKDVVDLSTFTNNDVKNVLQQMTFVNRRKDLNYNFTPLTNDEVPKSPGFLCAIDAEFVALSKEETEIRSDGSRFTIRPSKQALARVSVIRGNSGPKEGQPFIDDYIYITDPVVDYLTEYSGIKAGDLDPNISTYPLVSLKGAYKKLRYLVDSGCIFVGHGLKKDFRIINIIVPPKQIIDTVDIYYKKERQRKLSLRFLAWSVLRQDIQRDTHDSVEDARTALHLYKRYLELKQKGIFEESLEKVYEEGRLYNFKPPV
ncbi:poly(A)-specific ribonuclease [Blyttiomyces sp. JEL0837]|nr:poly(A)-specific ribonuclease [Blyttiomyces sp. JEL0837]